jgi:GNAT superfamily N-acetyltransferase
VRRLAISRSFDFWGIHIEDTDQRRALSFGGRCNSVKKRAKPTINLTIHECTRSIWSIFRNYHYLNTNLVTSNKNYVALYNDKPVAFISIGRSQYKYKYWQVSRLVVLPDYQGVGIGIRLLTWATQYFYEKTRLFVLSKCVNWISEVMTYNAELKENDHAIDATRYVLMNRGHGTAEPSWVMG